MPLQVITLTQSQRIAAQYLIAQGGKGQLTDARNARSLTRDLCLRGAAKVAERMAEDFAVKRREAQQALAAGDLARVRDLEAEARGTEPSWDNYLELDEPAREYSTESAALSWLNDLLAKADLAKVRTQQGQELTVAVDLTLLELVADLADAIAAAQSGK